VISREYDDRQARPSAIGRRPDATLIAFWIDEHYLLAGFEQLLG
jgi:hypothetical protein